MSRTRTLEDAVTRRINKRGRVWDPEVYGSEVWNVGYEEDIADDVGREQA